MSKKAVLAVLVCAVLASGCYHATIETGLPPSNEVHHKTFASAWVYGLVPPKTVDAMLECPNGVAKVETQLSFLNQVVGFLTLGIYTPMEIKVTCAAGGAAFQPPSDVDIVLPENVSTEEMQKAFMYAADLAVNQHRPIYISY